MFSIYQSFFKRRGYRLLLSLLAFGILLYFLAIHSRRNRLISTESDFPGTPSNPLRIALLRSTYTLDCFDEKWRSEQEGILSQWENFLGELGMEYTTLPDSLLEKGELKEFTVLLLPQSLCMSEMERNAIRKFLKEGKGVVASWAVGSRSPKGEWLGWGFLEELTGSRVADDLGDVPGVWITWVGGSPLSIGLGPGFRMELYKSAQEIGVLKKSRDGYWSDWSLNPRKSSETSPDAAVVHGNYGKGRFVWFGFTVRDVIEDSLSGTALKNFLMNGIRWAGGIPLAETWYWHGNDKGAIVFAQDVEDKFENSANAVEVLKREEIPGTFFCLSDLAIQHPELVREFAKVGEVGSHSDDHQNFKDQPYKIQLNRMEKTIRDLKKLTGRKAKGIRPPQDLFDENTLKAWAEVGGEYLFSNPETRLPLPELITVTPEKSLVLLPRTEIGDYDLIAVKGLTDKEEMLKLYKNDLDKIYRLNGFYMFSYHSQHLSSPLYVEVLESMVKYAKTLGLWITTAEEVSHWWKLRNQIRMDFEENIENELVLRVKNNNSEPVSNISLNLYLSRTPEALRIRSDTPDVPTPQYSLDENRLFLLIETLKANSIQTYFIKIIPSTT